MSGMSRLSNWLRREWLNLMLGTILVGMVVNGLVATRGPRDLMLLRARRADLEAKRADLVSQKGDLETTVRNLRSNDRYLEHLIRKELGYARSDELVYKFIGPGSDSRKEALHDDSDGARKQSVLAGLALQLLSEVGVR